MRKLFDSSFWCFLFAVFSTYDLWQLFSRVELHIHKYVPEYIAWTEFRIICNMAYWALLKYYAQQTVYLSL